MAFPSTTYTNGVTAFTALENKVAALGMTSTVLDQSSFIAAFLANFLDDPQLGAGATFASGTITTSEPGIAITQTWNDNAVTFKAMTIAVTATASAADSLLFDALVGGSSVFKVTKAGAVTQAQALTVSAGGITVTGNSTITGTLGGLTGLTVASGGATITAGGLTITAGGQTITAGKLQCAVSTTAAASLNLGNAGTAPTSPANGDLWIESNTIKARLNGATVTITTS